MCLFLRKHSFSLLSLLVCLKKKKKDFQLQIKSSQAVFEDLQDFHSKEKSLRKELSIPRALLFLAFFEGLCLRVCLLFYFRDTTEHGYLRNKEQGTIKVSQVPSDIIPPLL